MKIQLLSFLVSFLVFSLGETTKARITLLSEASNKLEKKIIANSRGIKQIGEV
jgi:hypothetical protein